MTLVDSLRTASRGPLLQVAKTSVAAILAWIVCDALFAQPPIFAAIAALLVVQPSVNQSLAKGVERSLGVITGVLLALGIGYLLGTSSPVILLVIVVSLVFAWVIKLGPGSSAQIPISAMLVLSIGGLTPGYAVERIVETIIGAVLGLVVNLTIVPPVLLRPAHLAVARLVRDTATALDTLADVLTAPASRNELDVLLEKARALIPLREIAAEALAKATESLTLNPRGGRLRRVLERDQLLFARLSTVRVRVTGMTRTVHDNYEPSLTEEATVSAIATELRRAAHDLRLLGRDVGRESQGDAERVDAEPSTAEIPALTAPLSVLSPHPDHWILIGSLLEDLRRVRQEITGGEN